MKNWKNYFEDKILQRGREYYNSNAVRIYSSSPNHVEAQVAGSNVYYLRILFHNSKLKSMYCNCPYEGNCKHLAATLYYIDDNPELLTKIDYMDLLSSLTQAELIEFLSKELSQNPDLVNKLKLFKKEPNWEYYQNKLQNCYDDSFKVLKFIDEDLNDLKEANQIDLILILVKPIVKYSEELVACGQYDVFDEIIVKIDDLMNQLVNIGFESQVCDFLADCILACDDESVLDLFTDTYSRFRSIEKLFEEN